ncbi:MAG: hypothetical protein K2X38_02320, partial [Gemmataceae bacterium]|nr:hypothetical protein [Gemmataceae bacterium]
MRRLAWMMTLALATVAPAQAPEEVSWKTVRYDGLAQEIADLHGKVLVVDFWVESSGDAVRRWTPAFRFHRPLIEP